MDVAADRTLEVRAVPWAWGLVVLIGAARVASATLRPTRDPVRRRRTPGPVDRLGRVVRRKLGRASDADGDRRAGWAVLVGPALLLVHPIAALLVVGVLLGVPAWRRWSSERLAREALVAELPWLAGLVRLGVGAGLPVGQALHEAASRTSGPASEALADALARTRRGASLADAIEGLRPVLGEEGRPLVAALVASVRHGAPVGPALEAAAVDLRTRARRRAEIRARKVPVRMLFPLVTCILPAFILLSVVPMVGGALQQLGPGL